MHSPFFSSDSMYSWFFYLGITFFIANNLLYGWSIDIFAVLLIWMSYKKYTLSTWFAYFMWFMILLDAITYIRVAIRRIKDIFTEKTEDSADESSDE